jgi:hypothetical protein
MARLQRVVVLLTVALAACLWIVPAHAAPVPWCGGSEETSSDRVPGLQYSPDVIHVVYATASDGPDNFAAEAPLIVGDVAAIDAWWRGQDPTRAPRWDLYPFPGCAPGFGQLDLSFVRLPQPATAYSDQDQAANRLSSDVVGSTSSDTKTLVYYDGPVTQSDECGVSSANPDGGGSAGVAIVWLQACGPDNGPPAETARIAAHELLHDLGAEPTVGPPHACPPPNEGHPCDSQDDILYPFVQPGATLASAVLDVGRDDYYGHSGTWWDVQDSHWLEHLPQFPLSVSVEGAKGTVVDSAGTVSCPSVCNVAVDNGAPIDLTAQPGPESTFVGWTGACSGRGACSATMGAAASVTAVFARASYAVAVIVRGRGKVTGNGVSCPPRCRGRVLAGTRVRLRATPARGYRFAGWGGACHGLGACVLAGDGSHAVSARFARR